MTRWRESVNVFGSARVDGVLAGCVVKRFLNRSLILGRFSSKMSVTSLFG